MALNDNNMDQHFSLLSSLLYLRSELKKAGFDKTETILGFANQVFFEDLKSKNIIDDNVIHIKSVIESVENLPPHKIKELIQLMEFAELDNDDTVAKN